MHDKYLSDEVETPEVSYDTILEDIESGIEEFLSSGGRKESTIYLMVNRETDEYIREALFKDATYDAHINKLYNCIYVVNPLSFEGRFCISNFNLVNAVGERNIRLEGAEKLFTIDELFQCYID